MPHSVNCCNHSDLDVVLSTAVKHDQVGSPMSSSSHSPAYTLTDAPTKDTDVENLRVIPSTAELLHDDPNACTVSTTPLLSRSSPSSGIKATSFKGARFQVIAKKAQTFDIEQRFMSILTPDVQETARASPNICETFAQAIKDRQEADSPVELSQQLHLLQSSLDKNAELTAQELSAKQEELSAKQEEAIRLEKKVLDNQEERKQLQVKALEQLAYPSGWDILEPFTDKYRLYFLCECGDHTKKAGSNSNIPHKVHFAKHEGYEITRPTEFFQHYGPYVLTILKMLKFGVSVASVAVPAVTHLINADALDHVGKGLQHLKDCIEPGMDQVICKIEKNSVDEGEAVESFTDQMENKEALEGADLRKLETFLKDKDENKVLGNVYRTVTVEGHVKWVCMDHYRENYSQMAVEAFRPTMDSLGGSFDENIGLVQVKLQSSRSANQLYLTLGNSEICPRARYCLWMGLHRNRSSSFGEGTQEINSSHSPCGSPAFSTKSQQQTAIDIHKIRIVSSKLRIHAEAVDCGSIVTTVYLQDSSIKPSRAQALSEVLKTNSTLTTLNLRVNWIGSNGALALSEALKTNSTLTTLKLYGNKIGDSGAQSLSQALKPNSNLTTLDLHRNWIGDNGAQALSEALKTNSTLTTLNLADNMIGDSGAQALSEALKTNSTLTTLNLKINPINDRVV
ncbi:hypothetical protein BGZ67_004596 [Mortierella alpina]|nr:hypothetical protein BGZ67_004596 [Mortierella alpina]